MKQCIIIGGGASVSHGIETGLWEKIEGQDIWSLNYSWRFMDYLPSRQIFVDERFYRENKKEMNELSQKIPIYTYCHKEMKDGDLKCIMYSKAINQRIGIEQMIRSNSLCVSNMGMSGEFALSLAIIEGYERIFLCGYDFGPKTYGDKNTHWYMKGFTKDPKLENKPEGRHTWWNSGKKLFSTGVGQPDVYFEKKTPHHSADKNMVLKKDLKFWEHFASLHKNIFNVSPESNIECFPKISYEIFYKILEMDKRS